MGFDHGDVIAAACETAGDRTGMDNTVARARAEQGDAAAFRLMQGQAMRVGQRRVELDVRIAELERQRLHSRHGLPSASLPEMRSPQHRLVSR